MIQNLEDYNVLFITLDSCRHDTLIDANAPNIRLIGKIRKAYSYASYTLPSHISMFSGYIPNVIDDPAEPYYCREILQLWRLAGSRFKDPGMIGVIFDEENIISGYKNLGHFAVGAGGLRWFSSEILTREFDIFHYYGKNNDYFDVFSPRLMDNFALNHIQTLISSIKDRNKWFIFINAHETHAPYDTGEKSHNPEITELLNYAKPFWGGKSLNTPDIEISQNILEPLRWAQVEAVEVVDRRIGRFIEILPKPFLAVVCGDHGEAFGEYFNGRPRYGHGFSSSVVMEVPLVIGIIE